MKSFAAAAVLLVPLVLASCGDDGSGPEPREPESIALDAADFELNDGDTIQIIASVFDQNDDVFTELPDDVVLTWSSDDNAVVTVLADGRMIGMSPGATTVRAATNGGLEATANVAVLPVATAIVAISGHDQSGLPNEALEDSVVFRVIDRHADGVAGVEVDISVTSGGGSISPSTAVSDAQGNVRVQWTLGPTVGAQAIEATSDEIEALTIEATITQVVLGIVDVPATVSQGAALVGTIRLNADLYPAAIGAAHLVLTWDPTKLQLQGGSLTSGDFARSVRWFDNATGELHVVSTNPAMTAQDVTAAEVTFDVIGGAGTSTTLGLGIEQLIGVNFSDATTAGVAADVVVTIH